MSPLPRSAAFVLASVFVTATAAAAAPDATIVVAADGKCTVAVKPTRQAKAKVHVKLPAAASTVTVLGEKATGSGTAFDIVVTKGESVEALGKLKIEATPAEGAAVSYECESDKTLFTTELSVEDPAKVRTKAIAPDDNAAQAWWVSDESKVGLGEIKRLKDLGKKLGLPWNTAFIVHKPTGSLIYPTGAALTEGTPIQVAILLPTKGVLPTPEITFDDCDAPDPQRLEPSTDKAKPAVAEAGAKQAGSYELHALGPWRRCGAGKLTYHLAFDKDTKEKVDTTFRIRPKYHFAGIALVGYDFARRTGYEKAMDATGTMTTIGQVDQRVGTIAYVGAQWMIGGVDYEQMRCWNYFLNLFVAANVASPLDDAVVGLALTPTGGASLALGASFHSSKRLKNGATVGQVFMGNGDVPTEDTWEGVKPGVFIGLAIDTRVADALSSRFKGGTSDDKAKDSGTGKSDSSKKDDAASK